MTEPHDLVLRAPDFVQTKEKHMKNLSTYRKALIAAVLAFVAAQFGEDVATPLTALLVAAGVYVVPNRDSAA